jgi:predicted lactoylglutathione lyase
VRFAITVRAGTETEVRAVMSPHISLITLGVADIARATALYEQLGFVVSQAASEASVSFFKASSVVLALWSREAQREDANAHGLWTGNGGIVVAQNVASESEVDAMMAKAEAAGAYILKPAAKTFWGGYNGYFADLDGHVWEIAHNPFWPLDENGHIELPA